MTVTEIATVSPSQPALAGLVDALDRVIDSGVVVCGEVIITVAGIELIRVDLRLLLTGIQGQPAVGRAS